MSRLQTINEQAPFLKYLGISFWVAWFGVAYNSSIWIAEGAQSTGPLSEMFTISTGSHVLALAVFALLAKRMAHVLSQPGVVLAAGGLASLGCILLITASPSWFPSHQLFYAGCAVTGVGTSVLALRTGLLLCQTHPGQALKSLILAEIVAALLQFPVFGLPGPLGQLAFIAFPLLSAGCFIAGMSQPVPPAAAEDSRLGPQRGFALIFFVIFVLSVSAMIPRGEHTSSIVPAGLAFDGSLTGLLTLVVLCAIALALASTRKPVTFGHLFYPMAIVIVSSLLFSYLFPKETQTGFIIAAVTYQAFDVVMWYAFSYMVFQSKVSAISLVAIGRAVVSTGVTIGNGLGHVCYRSLAEGTLTAPVIFLVLFMLCIGSFAVFSEQQLGRLLLSIPDEDDASCQNASTLPVVADTELAATDERAATKEDGQPQEHRATWEDGVDAIAASRGLTARESEVFALLAKGRGAQSISETLVISMSTARAHIRNIYSKLDVHSRQELLDLVEDEIGTLRG